MQKKTSEENRKKFTRLVDTFDNAIIIYWSWSRSARVLDAKSRIT